VLEHLLLSRQVGDALQVVKMVAIFREHRELLEAWWSDGGTSRIDSARNMIKEDVGQDLRTVGVLDVDQQRAGSNQAIVIVFVPIFGIHWRNVFQVQRRGLQKGIRVRVGDRAGTREREMGLSEMEQLLTCTPFTWLNAVMTSKIWQTHIKLTWVHHRSRMSDIFDDIARQPIPDARGPESFVLGHAEAEEHVLGHLERI
jgi:hypothetical protein